MRTIVSLTFFVIALSFSAMAASAEPCPVLLQYAVKTADAHTYAVGLKSTEDGVADVALTLYSSDDTYRAAVRHVVITRPTDPRAKVANSWISNPVYIALPTDAAPLEYAKLDTEDPDTHAPIACTSPVISVKNLGPASDPTFKSEIDEAVAKFAPGVATTSAAIMPREAKLTCARPFADASVTHSAMLSYPTLSQQEGHIGNAVVAVELASNGSVVGVHIYRSSGWPELDSSAKSAALQSAYNTQLFRCRPVDSWAIFQAEFKPQSIDGNMIQNTYYTPKTGNRNGGGAGP